MDMNENENLEALEAKLEEAKSIDEIVETLKEYGVDTTEEQLLELAENDQSDELNDEALETVAGGAGWFSGVLKKAAEAAQRIADEMRRSGTGKPHRPFNGVDLIHKLRR